MTKRHFFILFFSLALTLAACTACQQEKPAQNDEIVIGFSQLGNESDWREKNTDSIIQAAQKADYKLLFENAHQKQENQIKAVRSFIASRVDVIVLSPIVETGWDTVLSEAKAANIPVFLSDRLIKTDDPTLYKSLVATNGIEQGKKAAEFLQKKFSDTTDEINIVEIAGTLGASSATERATGFREVLDQDPRFKIVATKNADYMLSKGRQAIETLDHQLDLSTINVIFSHNDDMTLGIVDYLETTDLKPGKDIVIVSIDAQQSAIDLLKAGKINCTVECNPDNGPKLISVINHYLNGGELERKYFLEERVFSEFDDLSAIKERGY